MKKAIIRIILFLISAVLVVFYIGPVITVGEINIGILTGLAAALIFLLYSLCFDKVNSSIRKLCNQKSGKIATGIISFLLCACIIIAGVALTNIIIYGKRDKNTTQVAVVLGCQVNGTKPGPFLKGRINAAYEFLTENQDSVAVLSGGQGQGETISEAQCMYNILTEKGIDKSRLFIEDKSTSTKENFENSIKLLVQSGISMKEVTVITNDFHEYRASMIATECGLTASQYSCKTPWNGYMPFVTREIYAVIYQFCFQ